MFITEMKLHLIQIIIGDGATTLGYNVIGPAYDVAFHQSVRRYPAVFADDSRARITRHYVSGEGYSCQESAGLLLDGLSVLLPCRTEVEFCIVLTPGCTFEVLAIADFAREADVAVLASTGGIPNHDRDPVRFSTLVSLSGSPFPILAKAVTELLKHYAWNTFNVLCDKNPDPLQISSLEVFCGMIQDLTRLVGLSPVEHVFNSAEPNYRQLLRRTKTSSTVNIMVAYPSARNEILTAALTDMMNTGEYHYELLAGTLHINGQRKFQIFFALPLSPFEVLHESVNPAAVRDNQVPFFDMLPYLFQFSFDDVNWEALANKTAAMNEISQMSYNWTVVKTRERNINRLAALESFQAMAEVVNEGFHRLSSMSARQFTALFHGRSFNFPSRKIRVANTGSRLCNINIRQLQFQNSTYSHESIFVSANDDLSLHPVKYPPSIIWPGDNKFPPDFHPICYLPSGVRCPTEKTDSTIIPAIACSAILLILVVTVVMSVRHKSGIADNTWWIVTEEQLQGQVISADNLAYSARTPELVFTKPQLPLVNGIFRRTTSH